MKISTKKLHAALDLLMRHIESSGHGSIEISEDFYWNVPDEDRYNPYEQPTNLDLGQLSDDWKELEAIADGSSEPLGYGLVWASSILRRIGEITVR